MFVSEDKTKAKRADAGKPRLMPRDAEVFTWLEEMRCIWEDDLAWFLANIAGRDQPLSPNATQSAVRRWTALGLAERQRVVYGRPAIVTLTQAGAVMAGASSWKVPSLMSAPHTADVARFRLWSERVEFFGPDAVWVSERRWRQRFTSASEGGAHAPDAVIEGTPAGTVALEVERSLKTPERTAKIAAELTVVYDRVLYVAANEQVIRSGYRALEAALDRTPGVRRDAVKLYTMPEGVMAPRESVQRWTMRSPDPQ